MFIAVRSQGSGSAELDGTWERGREYNIDFERRCPGGDFESTEINEFSDVTVIAAGAYTYTWDRNISGVENGRPYVDDDHRDEIGTIRYADPGIYWTATEIDGEEINVADQYVGFYGYRVADDIVAIEDNDSVTFEEVGHYRED